MEKGRGRERKGEEKGRGKEEKWRGAEERREKKAREEKRGKPPIHVFVTPLSPTKFDQVSEAIVY